MKKNVRFYPFTKGYGEKWKEKKEKTIITVQQIFAIPQLMLRVQKTQRIIKSERDDNKKKGKEF